MAPPAALLRGLSAVLGASMASVGFAVPALAAPGELDHSFSGNGKLTTNFTPALDEANDVAVQDNGKIVAVGMADGRFALARYRANGNLDDSFSDNGKVRTDFTSGADRALGVATQDNGRIVVAGIADIGANSTFALARYRADGSLDDSFGGNGKVTTNFTPLIDGANDVAIQADGKIVAAGIAGSSKHTGMFALARYNADGTPDDSFDDDGMVTTNFGPDFDGALGMAIQENGRIVAVGTAVGPNTVFALARYLGNGDLDDSFSGNGMQTTNFTSGFDVANDVALQGNGRIVAAGFADDGTFALARYRADGSLDDSFSDNGKVTTNFTPSTDRANDVAIQGNGKIVAVGVADGEPFDPTFALARYQADGDLDDPFGGNGRVMTDFSGGLDEAEGVALQENGRIVAVGVADATEGPAADPTFALARYLAA